MLMVQELRSSKAVITQPFESAHQKSASHSHQ